MAKRCEDLNSCYVDGQCVIAEHIRAQMRSGSGHLDGDNMWTEASYAAFLKQIEELREDCDMPEEVASALENNKPVFVLPDMRQIKTKK